MWSSTLPGSAPVRSISSRRTPASRSTGWTPDSEPFRLPIGVRTAPTITASRVELMTAPLLRPAHGGGNGDQSQHDRYAQGDDQDDPAFGDERDHADQHTEPSRGARRAQQYRRMTGSGEE